MLLMKVRSVPSVLADTHSCCFKSNFLCPCSVPVKLDMRNYFLSYLDRCSRACSYGVKAAALHTTGDVLHCSRGPALEPFVVTSLVQLLCRTTKLCWFDDDAFRNIVDDAKQFLEKVGARPSPHLHDRDVSATSAMCCK